jgi:hypothetical protein
MDAAAGATDAAATVMVAATLDVGSRDAVTRDVARSAGSMAARFAAAGASTEAAQSAAAAGASTVAADSTAAAADTVVADTAKLITHQ